MTKNGKIFCLVMFAVFLLSNLQAQEKSKQSKKQLDSATLNVYISAAYSYQFPFFDWRDMYKSNSAINANFGLKTQRNWTYDINYSYIFNRSVRDPLYVLGNIVNAGGLIIGSGESAAEINVEQRAWSLSFCFGKVIPVLKYNKNSGIWLKMSGGYISYKYRIADVAGSTDNAISQIDGDYSKLYDNKSRGFVLSQFAGFFYMSRFRMLNFYGGLEVSEIWGKSIRPYSVPAGGPDQKTKFGLQLGIKVGWLIPLYEKRKITKVYYY